MLIDSVNRAGKNYYPQVFLEEFQCVVKEKKMNKYITDKTETSSDKENSKKKNRKKKILMGKNKLSIMSMSFLRMSFLRKQFWECIFLREQLVFNRLDDSDKEHINSNIFKTQYFLIQALD